MAKVTQLGERRHLPFGPKELEAMYYVETRNAVLHYYDVHPGEHYPSDVAAMLGRDPRVVFEVTEELAAEGRLK